jgi:hypothetical protein
MICFPKTDIEIRFYWKYEVAILLNMHYRELTRELKILADDIPHYDPKRRKLSPAQVRWLLGYDGVGGVKGFLDMTIPKKSFIR